MLFQPAIIALLLASGVSALMLTASIPFAVRLLRHWDLSSGSETQLALERRTYLVATLLKIVMASELAALVLFIFNADRMAALFTGAMCAVGTLKVDPYGFPALYLKMTVFFLSAAWLVLDHVDSRGWDYPLIRVKYTALIVLAPVLLASAGAQLAYFLGLRADVITSCCSTLFSGGGITVTENSLGSLSHGTALTILFGVLAVVMGTGLAVVRAGGRFALLHAAFSIVMLFAGLMAVISTISVYVYELPHHHCPFCILKREYGHVGYFLYIPLFVGTACGIGGGIAWMGRKYGSLRQVAPAIARTLVLWSLAGFVLFGAVSLWLIFRSHLILFEH